MMRSLRTLINAVRQRAPQASPEYPVVKPILAALFAASCSFANAANVPPTVVITAPGASANFVAQASVALGANATDSDGTVSKVVFYRDGTLIGTVTAAPYNFNWTNVSAGTYSVTARATDNLGAVVTSAPVTVTVKPNVLPTVSLTSPVSGEGFAAPGIIPLRVNAADSDGTISKVEYFNGATLVASSTSAPFSVNLTNQVINSYSITARVTDNKGGVATSAAALVQVKANVAPTVSIVAPADNTKLVSPTAVTLTASPADSDGTIKNVAFYDGTTWLRTVSAAPYSMTWASVPVGTHSITVRATDDKGAITTSAPISIVVAANVNPTVALTAPANKAIIYGSEVTLAATAADSDGAVAQVAFYHGTTLLGADSSAPFSFTWSNLLPGIYGVTARVMDDKGYTTNSSPVTFTVKAAPVPVVSITSPVDGARFVAPASFTISSSASAAGDTISKVEYISGGNLIGTATVPPYTISLSNVEANSYSVAAKATGSLGGTATSALVNLVVVSNAIPTVSLNVDAASTVAPATVTLRATASDSDGSVAKVAFYNGGALLGEVTAAPFTFVWNDVTANTYSITAVATDDRGATSTSPAQSLTVTSPGGPGASSVYYVHADQINTAREITDAAGVKVWEAGSDPFGAVTPNENPSARGRFVYNQRFPGQYFDAETGLHYNYYRDYDPQTGRYIQSDPIGLAGGINTYAYVGGNPILHSDPYGLKIEPIGTAAERARIRQGIRDLSRASSSAAKMIAEIEASSRILTIEVGCESDHYGSDKNGDAKDDHITWNPNKKHMRDGSEDWHHRPSFIGLGHELIHAWADFSGLKPQGATFREQAAFDEYGTVGIPRKNGKPTARYPYTENKFRAQCGCAKPRKEY